MAAKSKNPWIIHLNATRKANPKIKEFAKLAKLAKSTYKPKK
jgi:hypothetical protein